jgi:hypothetical protein
MKRRRVTGALIVLAEAALISLALVYLAAYFGLPLVREAGGWIAG